MPRNSPKSTLMRSIVGVQRLRGNVQVLGLVAGSAGLRGRIGYLTQAPSVYRDLTAGQNLRCFATVLGVDPGEIPEVLEAHPVNPRITLATTARVLTRLRRDHRTTAMLLFLPAALLSLLRWIYAGSPALFDRIGPQLLGVLPSWSCSRSPRAHDARGHRPPAFVLRRPGRGRRR
jgi:ABC-type branched-subunit amino acid transport system ATPase component